MRIVEKLREKPEKKKERKIERESNMLSLKVLGSM